PAPSGKLQLINATAELQGVGEPLQVASATATLADRTLTIVPFSAGFKDGPTVRGPAGLPLPVGTPHSCASVGGQIALRNGSLICEACKLQSAGESFDVSGTASFARALDVRLESSGRGASYAVSGPLDQPRVESVESPHLRQRRAERPRPTRRHPPSALRQ